MCARSTAPASIFSSSRWRPAILPAWQRCAAATDIAIGADEGIHSLDDIRRHHERKAARGVSLKAIKLGGIRAVTEAGRLCDSLGMSVNISCKTGESSIACAAALHVASVIPDIAWGLTLTHTGLAEDVVVTPDSDRQRPCRRASTGRALASMSMKTACAVIAWGCRAEWGLAVRHDFSVVMAGLVPAFVTQTLNKSLPGLTRQSMRQRSRKNQYCVRTWNCNHGCAGEAAHVNNERQCG